MSLKNCKTILIAVDFSADCKSAVREGFALAKMSGANIVLNHAIHDLPDSPGFYHKKKDTKKSIHLMADAAAEMMQEFIKKNDLAKNAKKAKIKLSTSISKGIPADEIVKAAKKADAGVIVVGTSGRSGLSKLFVGSTAQRVVQSSKVPVLVVRN